jgi:outer membrane protein assembly factor BamD (BamD/ComL family)
VRTRAGYTGIVQGDINAVLQALKGDPWSADLTFGAGVLYYNKGDEENAVKYFTRFMEIAPNSPVIQRKPPQ